MALPRETIAPIPLTGVLRLTALAVVLVALTASAGSAAGAAPSFVQIASGLHEAVYVTSAPGDASTLYVVEQRGTIEMVRDGKIAGTFLDLSSRVLDDGERGLLSLAFDPGYAQNHEFYVDYSDLNGDSHVAELTSRTASACRRARTICSS